MLGPGRRAELLAHYHFDIDADADAADSDLGVPDDDSHGGLLSAGPYGDIEDDGGGGGGPGAGAGGEGAER